MIVGWDLRPDLFLLSLLRLALLINYSLDLVDTSNEDLCPFLTALSMERGSTNSYYIDLDDVPLDPVLNYRVL